MQHVLRVSFHSTWPLAKQLIVNIRGDSRSARLQVSNSGQLILTECNRSRLMSLKFPFALILAGTIVALWRQLRNNEWAVLMRTRPLLRNWGHRAMTTPVSPLRARLIHISPSYWSISFVCNYSRMGTIHWIGIKINILSIASKKHSIWYELYLKKYLIAEGSSGSNWWAMLGSLS